MTGVSRERWPLILGLWAAPASIAVSEFFLSIAALTQVVALLRRRRQVRLPRCLWFWIVWAALQFVMWRLSPEPALGWSEIRHQVLLAVLFLTLLGFNRPQELLTAWKGIFVVAAVSSLYLIGQFVYRLRLYGDEIAAGGDAGFYLRSGGLLNHWMVYGTVEIVVVAGMIAFWTTYRNQRRRLWPLVVINFVGVIVSLTRMAWITCLLLVAVNLVWRRSKWVWALPLMPLVLYALAPDAVKARVATGADPAYYSNAERLQMVVVGWKMVRDRPWTGVGPGRIDKLYESYLSPGEPVPSYHGHLHNNLIQIAAQSGILVVAAALLFVVAAFRDLLRARKAAAGPDSRFLSEAATLAFIGFLFAGLFEYTYGHSLGLIMIAFAVLPALLPKTGLEGNS